MRPLRNKTNVVPPDSDYTFGRIKDNPGDFTGTPVNELLYGDMHQFFEKLMLDSGLAANGLPENAYSGFQLNQALQAVIQTPNPWITLPLINGWSNSGANVLKYRIDRNRLEITGLIQQQFAPSSDIFANLPNLTLPAARHIKQSILHGINVGSLANGLILDIAGGSPTTVAALSSASLELHYINISVSLFSYYS